MTAAWGHRKSTKPIDFLNRPAAIFRLTLAIVFLYFSNQMTFRAHRHHHHHGHTPRPWSPA
jgi:hypothetical protein